MSDWVTPDWPAPCNVQALFTTRHGGVSSGPYASLNLGDHVGDNPLVVKQNRAKLRRALPSEPQWLKQVHGSIPIWVDNNVIVPEGVTTVFIFADKDKSGGGQKAAEKLAARLHTEGKQVHVLMPPIPIPQGKKSADWLNVLNKRGKTPYTPGHGLQIHRSGNSRCNDQSIYQ